MAWEVREKRGKFYVVNSETEKVRGAPFDDEDDADDKADELNFREEVRSGVGRIPGKELSAEEKAAAYDKLMAEKNQPPPDPNLPPKKEGDGKDDKTPPVKKKGYWSDYED